MTRFFIASDSFKGTASSLEVAEALKSGLLQVPGLSADDDISIVSMADGGEGTLGAFLFAHPEAIKHNVEVLGPTGEIIESFWVQLDDSTAVVELACGSGITLANPLDALHAHSYGFGQVLAEAIAAGMTTIFVGIGGSASTDGGMGMLEALGVQFLDQQGNTVSVLFGDSGNAALKKISALDVSNFLLSPNMNPRSQVNIRVISDVTNPLNGPSGAAAVFGPQKGALPDEIAHIDANLKHFAEVVSETFSEADRDFPGSGAAGGCGFALHAIGAALLSGPETVAEALKLDERIAAVDYVITGEGKFDVQSLSGKVPHAVAEIARSHGVSTILVAGVIEGATDSFHSAWSLTEIAESSEEAMTNTVHWLEQVGRLIGEDLATRSDHPTE